jgi:PAS domain S-box-containing protein
MAVEDKARLAEELANLQGGRTLRSEWKIRRKDGSFFPCEVSAKRLPDGRLQVIARDVTERRRTEDMLREREERLRSLFNHQIVGMAVTSPEKRWLEVNDTWCQMMGYSREELAGLDWATLTHPEDLPADLEQFGRILSGKSDRYQLEKRFIRKDGTVLYAEVSVGCVRRPDGSPEYIVGLAANISERKRAEELLRESEERFRTIFENAGLGMALVDWQGYPVKCNPALQKMLGFTENELSNMVFTEFTHPDDVDLDWRLYSELVTGKRDKYEIEKRYIKKDGQVMWGQLTVSQVKNKDGTPAKYMVGMVEDITERKRAEEQLRRSEERYRSLIEATSEKVWTAQAGPGAVEVASWREFTGQTAEEARDNWLAAVHPDDREQTKTAWLNFLKKGGVYDEQYRLRRRDGEYRWLSVRGVPVRERDGRIREWIGTFKDITERKRTERELRAAHDRLTKELAERTRAEAEIVRLSERLIKAQEEERTRIAGELHDHLSQQIAGLGIALSNIKRQIPEHRREGRNQAERAYDRLLALGEGIRQLSHELHPAIIEHSGLVPALESYCTEFESRTNVSVTVQAEGQFDDLSANTRLGVYRIAQEALHNIWKHSGVKEAGIYLAHAGERVQMRVSDRGAGFDPAQPSKEVGLGLISMRERARLLGGTFTVESSAGRGTTITVDIPVNHISQAKASD